MSRRRWTAALGVCAALAAASAAAKPPNADIAARRADLGELRERIETLRKEIAAGESSRAEAADQLRDSERSISELQRGLRELAGQRGETEAALLSLGQQTRALEAELAGQQGRLDALLVRQYMRATPDTLRLVLSGENPNQVARDLHYLSIIALARRGMLVDIETLLRRQREIGEQTRTQAANLAAVEARQREQHGQLTHQRDARKQLLGRLSERIATQQREVGALQRDEQRLSRLIDRLSRLVAPRPAKPRPEAAPTKRSDAPAVEEPGSQGVTGAFARLRGQLRLPVTGTLSGRFGSARDGGGNWKGVFIRAPSGADVRAIAAGRVVFAEWMRGFGNLLILDHGEGYLSIYGYNDALLRQVGDEVRSGDSIANVGNSGGQPETGLYFEIRHQGQALDPLLWAKRR